MKENIGFIMFFTYHVSYIIFLLIFKIKNDLYYYPNKNNVSYTTDGNYERITKLPDSFTFPKCDSLDLSNNIKITKLSDSFKI